jgi:hypothetical protein
MGLTCATDNPDSDTKTSTQPTTLPMSKPIVLVIDDERDIRELLAIAPGRMGLVVPVGCLLLHYAANSAGV